MANNISVAITADVADLVAKRAVMSAELKAAKKDLNEFAKQAKAGGSTAELRTGMLESASAVAKTKAEISLLDRELKSFSTTQSHVVGITGQQRQSLIVLGEQFRQVSTMAALGASGTQIFASQFGQITQAASLAFDESSKFGSFLTGGWGIAITTAIAVLGPLVAKLFETRDAEEGALQKLKEDARKTEEARRAKEEFARTEEGVTQAIYDQQEALGKDISNLKTEAERSLDAAMANREHEIAIRNKTRALLEDAIAQEKANEAWARSPNAAKEGVSGAAIISNSQQRVGDLQKQLAAEEAAIKVAQQNVVQSQSLYSVELGKQMADPLEVIRRKYEGAGGLIEQARKRAVAESKVGDELQRQITLLKQQEDKEIAAAQKAAHPGRAAASSGLYGREVDYHEARSIAESAGMRVTSDFRTRDEQQWLYDHKRTAENPVARPGTSAHERGDALDIAFGAGVTPQSIRKTFADEGVRLTKILKETGHFHIEWSVSGAAKVQREEDKAARDQAAQARQLATGATDTRLTLQKIDIGDRRQQAQADYGAATGAAEDRGDFAAAIDLAGQKRDALRRLAEEEAADELAAQAAKKAAYAGDVVAVQAAANQEAVIRANLSTQLNEIERRHTQEVEAENQKRARAAERAAREELAAKMQTVRQIEGYESRLVSGILSGRENLGQMIGQIANDVVAREIEADLRYLTEHALLSREQLAMDRTTAQGGVLVHVFAERQKQAATVASQGVAVAAKAATAAQSAAIDVASTAGHVAAEGAKTAATVAGSGARVAATAAGASQSAAITSAHNLKEITSHAATAAAAAYHAMAGIPIVGPVLGAAAAVATFAAVEAYGALASFEVGTNALPADMVAKVHANERIVPAADNRRLIELTERGAGIGPGPARAGDTYNNHFHGPTISPQLPFADQLAKHERHLFDMIQRGLRRGALKAA